MAKEIPPQSDLTAVLEYNALSGALIWRSRDNIRPSVNARLVGKVAGKIGQRGYIYIGINGEIYGAHRIIWKMVYGVDPVEIDHIDRNPSNNSLANLRESNRYTNTHNTGLSAANTSGCKGVHFHKQSGKWRSRIRVMGKTKDLGLHDDVESASAAYRKAAISALGDFAGIH